MSKVCVSCRMKHVFLQLANSCVKQIYNYDNYVNAPHRSTCASFVFFFYLASFNGEHREHETCLFFTGGLPKCASRP